MVNNHNMKGAQARRAMATYESLPISWFIRMTKLGVKAESIYEKITAREITDWRRSRHINLATAQSDL